MPLFTIQRRCQDCKATRALVRELREDIADYRSQVTRSLLDYETLYEKVRTNLSKMAKREKDESKELNGSPFQGLWEYRNQARK